MHAEDIVINIYVCEIYLHVICYYMYMSEYTADIICLSRQCQVSM